MGGYRGLEGLLEDGANGPRLPGRQGSLDLAESYARHSSDQLRILATSASVDQGPKSSQFLREFFGRSDRFELISGAQVQPPKGAHRLLQKHADSFAGFAATVQLDPLETMAPPELASHPIQQAVLDLAQSDRKSVV